MTERAAWLMAAAGWLLLVLAAYRGEWWPAVLGAGLLLVFIGFAGVRPLLRLLAVGAQEVAREARGVVSQREEA